jgi:phage repressor protein C with HTH and peptisase S24 domain
METEGERYTFIQKQSGLTKKDFAGSLGLSKSMGFQIATGRLKPSRPVLEKLADAYQVNLNWFVCGKGAPPGSDEAVIELVDQEAAAGQGREIDDYAGKQALRVPPSLISPYRPEKLQAVYVAGDSMIDEKIYNGDVVIFHPGLKEGNAIYVVSTGNALAVKRVDFDSLGRSITLISANPAYPPRHFSGPELETVQIAGRVIATIHRV